MVRFQWILLFSIESPINSVENGTPESLVLNPEPCPLFPDLVPNPNFSPLHKIKPTVSSLQNA